MSTAGVVLVAVGFMCATLLTIYLYFDRANATARAASAEMLKNTASSAQSDAAKVTDKTSETSETSKPDAVKGKKNKGKKQNGQKPSGSSSSSTASHVAVSSTVSRADASSTASQSNSSDHGDDDGFDDIIALARLQGHKLNGVRQRPSPRLDSVSTGASSVRTQSPVKRTRDQPRLMAPEPLPTPAPESPSLTPEEMAFVCEMAKEEFAEATAQETVQEIVIVGEATVSLDNDSVTESSVSASTKSPISTSVSPPEAFVAVMTAVKTSESQSSSEWSHVRTREEETIRSLKNRLGHMQGQLDRSENAIVAADRTLAQSQSRVRLLEQEVKEQRQALFAAKTAADTQLAALRTANRDMIAKLALTETDNQETIVRQETIRQLQGELARLEGERSALRRQNEELSASARDTDEELHRLRNTLEQELTHHRAEQLNTAGANTALHQEIAQLKQELQSALHSNTHAEQRDTHTQAELQTLQHEQIRLSTENAALKTEVARMQEEAAERENEAQTVPSAANDADQLRAQLAEAEAKLASLQVDLQREIKRADVSRKVYELKMAELERNK